MVRAGIRQRCSIHAMAPDSIETDFMDWTILADEATVEKTADALRENGFEVFIAKDGSEAKRKALELIPEGSEVFTATSTTAEQIGLANQINESGKYVSIRKKLMSMDRNKERAEMARASAAPEWTVGSVHAITEDGKAIIASGSGSQLPAYAYGSHHVLWIAGTHKIVKDLEHGFKRIYEHSLPLESERARKAYGVPGSTVAKLLIIQKEHPGRIQIILVKEVLGF